ncbi:Signal recognition particle core component, partial [Ascosphaera acerosa]
MLFKAFHETPKPEDSDRLFSYQRHIALANSGVIDLLAHKTDGLARTTGASVRAACTASADVNTLSTLNLAAVIRRARAARPDGVGEPSYREEATKLLRQRPTDVGLLLTVVQLNVAEGRLANALNVLKQALAQLDAASTSDSDKSV